MQAKRTPFFDREREQARLLKQLRARPESILLVFGPQTSGKSHLLGDLLLGDKLDARVSWSSGRSQQLSDGHVMAWVLSAELKVQQGALQKFRDGVRYAAQGVARTMSGVPFKWG